MIYDGGPNDRSRLGYALSILKDIWASPGRTRVGRFNFFVLVGSVFFRPYEPAGFKHTSDGSKSQYPNCDCSGNQRMVLQELKKQAMEQYIYIYI